MLTRKQLEMHEFVTTDAYHYEDISIHSDDWIFIVSNQFNADILQL